MNVLDFGWGDTRGLREKILSIYTGLSSFQSMPLETYGYPPYEGDPELVSLVSKLTNRLTGHSYKFVAITSGCTHAVNASIYALSNSGTDSVNTRKLYYPRYPTMIELTPYLHQNFEDFYYGSNDIVIIDSPSNPLGLVGHGAQLKTDRIIWDAAYHTPTYGAISVLHNFSHKVFCGSLSKLTGINGIRLGWVATDDQDVYAKLQFYLKSSVCGVSYPSQYVAKQILSDDNKLDWYFLHSRRMIEYNKEEVLRLKHIFGQDDISPFGMFAFFKTDDKLEELFRQAKVVFTQGKDCGADYQSVRINLANTNEMTKEMVDRIIKLDRSAR